MQVTAAVCVALLLVVAGCSAEDEEVEWDEPSDESESGLEAAEAAGAVETDALGADLVKESRLGSKAKASPRSRYSRYNPGYSPEYYYPPNYPPMYPRYYPSYPSYNYPPVVYPTNYPPAGYPGNNYYQPGYSPYNPYDPYGSGVNEYSARHERS